MDINLKLNQFGHQLGLLLENRGFLEPENPFLNSIQKARHINRWFTESSILKRLQEISTYLKNCKLDFRPNRQKKLGLISEEHVPFEEFISVLEVLSCGYTVEYKLNSDYVLKHLFEWMQAEIVDFKGRIIFTEGFIKSADLYYITSREEKPDLEKSYFAPKNVLFDARHQSCAFLTGNETDTELTLLAENIFDFYGQSASCVKKIFVPESFDIRRIYEFMQQFYTVMDNHPYANNYQYQQSVYLMNRVPHYDNGFLLLKEDKANKAPTAVMFYDFYKEANIQQLLDQKSFYSILGKKFLPFESAAKQLLRVSEKLKLFLQ